MGVTSISGRLFLFLLVFCNQALIISACWCHSVGASAEPSPLAASDACKLVWSFLAGAAVIFQVFLFLCPTFPSVSHLHKRWESAPPRTRPPTNTHAASAAPPLCAKCRYFHYQWEKRTLFFFEHFLRFSLPLLCTLSNTSSPHASL